jgi:hypothetical protein
MLTGIGIWYVRLVRLDFWGYTPYQLHTAKIGVSLAAATLPGARLHGNGR